MRIDPAGWPFVGGAALLAGIGAFVGAGWLAAAGVLLAVLFLFFFRDPERVVAAPPDAVLSPADGRVMVAGDPTGEAVPDGSPWRQISIFLSPMDVHVNRVPVGGRVTRVMHKKGRFLPAYRAEAGDLNERCEIWVDHDGQTVIFRQIVGVLARRVVCRIAEGDLVRTGDRFGVMKFGSRMDVFLPATAVLAVRAGDRVVGGVTVLARLPR